MAFALYPQFMPYPKPADKAREEGIRAKLGHMLAPMRVRFEERDSPGLELLLPWSRIEYDLDAAEPILSSHDSVMNSVAMAARSLRLHLLSAAVNETTTLGAAGAFVGVAAFVVPAVVRQEIESDVADGEGADQRIAATLGLLAAVIGLGALIGNRAPGESRHGIWIRSVRDGRLRFQAAAPGADALSDGHRDQTQAIV